MKYILLLATLLTTGAYAQEAAFNPKRSLVLENIHNGEEIFIEDVENPDIPKVNRFLRDWRRNSETKFDMRLLVPLYELTVDAKISRLRVISAYRTPETNRMLGGTAKDSYHIERRAIDIASEQIPFPYFREFGERIADKYGLRFGIYTHQGFIHLDTGPSGRRWRK